MPRRWITECEGKQFFYSKQGVVTHHNVYIGEPRPRPITWDTQHIGHVYMMMVSMFTIYILKKECMHHGETSWQTWPWMCMCHKCSCLILQFCLKLCNETVLDGGSNIITRLVLRASIWYIVHCIKALYSQVINKLMENVSGHIGFWILIWISIKLFNQYLFYLYMNTLHALTHESTCIRQGFWVVAVTYNFILRWLCDVQLGHKW